MDKKRAKAILGKWGMKMGCRLQDQMRIVRKLAWFKLYLCVEVFRLTERECLLNS